MRFFLTYALLVGAPLLVLLGVLNAGARLQAPPSVGGEWSLDVAATRSSVPPLTVVQSGRVLELRWGAAKGLGRLRAGERVEGSLAGGWTLVATRGADARLVGTLTRGAERVEFAALRAPKAATGGGH